MEMILFLLHLIVLCACGNDKEESIVPELNYYLESPYTNKNSNNLILDTNIDEQYHVNISGTNFTLGDSLNLTEDFPVQNTIPIFYDAEGSYSMNLVIKTPLGDTYAQEVLSWEYSSEIPSDPIISFSEEASSDNEFLMLLSSSLSDNDVDIWVEGDIIDSFQNTWMTIPPSLVIPIKTTTDDGIKELKIKYRNLYGNESNLISTQITKKSQGPTNCEVTAQSSQISSNTLRIYIAASSDATLSYLVRGDVATATSYQDFTGSTVANVELIPTTGEKNIQIKIRDIAENYCPDTDLVIDIDSDHKWIDMNIKDNPIWTDTSAITLQNTFPSLKSDTPEMKIFGGVKQSANTFNWIPFQEEIEIELLPVSGHRFVFVQYRTDDKPGSETERIFSHIYLKPFVLLYDQSSYIDIVVSNILETESITITGCDETYSAVAFQESYTCTNAASNIIVTFNFSDGTSLQKTLDSSSVI